MIDIYISPIQDENLYWRPESIMPTQLGKRATQLVITSSSLKWPDHY